MSLKRIELQGFKSFRDKTVINFEHGYTCIVGPNGCGKSNVSDAIRWVLGEQSAKQLRGENMKGVIFSGTATLPEMGYAEVTLVFDNSDGMFQTTYEEIAITRKVFRSKQDNYYYINHKPCRRSDIIELMRGTGAGKESLSIIEQGAVSNVMRVKPEDRRVIFDEAAGISGAKIEKKKNLKQLAETQLNIDTLNVRIEEMDKQLGPLRKQMEAVNKYEIYHDELQLLEFNMFIYKYEHADSEKEKERAKIRDYEEFLRTKEALLEKTRLKIDDVQRQIDDNDRQILGCLIPRYTYGLVLDLGWKGLNLNVQFQGVGKADAYISGGFTQPCVSGNTFRSEHMDNWTPENPGAKFPRLSYTSDLNKKVSTFWMADASYLRLKNLQLSWTLPKKALSAMKIKNLTVFANATNLFSLDNYYQGYDPETAYQSGSQGATTGSIGDVYPLVSTYTFGVEVKF